MNKTTSIILSLIIGLIIGGGAVMTYQKADKDDMGMMNHNMSGEMNGMMAGLEGKTGDEFDKAFLSEMIMHHQGAIDMANSVLKNAKHQEIKDLAKNIISAQSSEIKMMQDWQSKWYPNDAKLISQEKLTNREVALLCTTDMATEYHIHPMLEIIINGISTPIPSDLGIQPTCMTSIHTHQGDGTIHVESPLKRDFTLEDFFAVWQKDFSKEKILDEIVTPSSEIVMTVNGQKIDTYENTILKDKDKIVISYQNR